MGCRGARREGEEQRRTEVRLSDMERGEKGLAGEEPTDGDGAIGLLEKAENRKSPIFSVIL